METKNRALLLSGAVLFTVIGGTQVANGAAEIHNINNINEAKSSHNIKMPVLKHKVQSPIRDKTVIQNDIYKLSEAFSDANDLNKQNEIKKQLKVLNNELNDACSAGSTDEESNKENEVVPQGNNAEDILGVKFQTMELFDKGTINKDEKNQILKKLDAQLNDIFAPQNDLVTIKQDKKPQTENILESNVIENNKIDNKAENNVITSTENTNKQEELRISGNQDINRISAGTLAKLVGLKTLNATKISLRGVAHATSTVASSAGAAIRTYAPRFGSAIKDYAGKAYAQGKIYAPRVGNVIKNCAQRIGSTIATYAPRIRATIWNWTKTAWNGIRARF